MPTASRFLLGFVPQPNLQSKQKYLYIKLLLFFINTNMKTPKKYIKLLLSAPLRLCVILTHPFTQQYQKIKYHRLFKALFFTTLLISLSVGQVVSAQTPNANLLVEQGIKDYKNGNFISAEKHWQEALKKYQKNPSARAVVNENLGRVYQKLGENKKAIQSLSDAIDDYGKAQDIQQLGRVKTELAQVYSNLGQPRKAIALLCGAPINKESQEIKCTPQSAAQIAIKYNDKQGHIAALGVLGEAYRLIGKYELAIGHLEVANKLAPDNFLVLNSLGNVHRSRAQLLELRAKSAEKINLPTKVGTFNNNSQKDYKEARKYFQSSIQFARQQKQPVAQMRALLNLIQLDSRTGKIQNENDPNLVNAVKLLQDLPDSVTKIYGAIDLAYLQNNSQGTSPFTTCPTQRILPENQALNLLQKSVLTSNNLQDSRLKSYTNGALGHFWECRQDNEQALKYTQNAILAADKNLGAKESLYLWEWQAGRILDQQQQKDKATAYYQRAFEILEGIRQDILTAKRDVQFDFRDVVRPLYRTLAESQLELLKTGKISEEKRPDELSKVVKTIDGLKLAELQNYFGNDCILSALNPQQVDELLEDKDNRAAFKNTAFLSSIILDGKTAILLQLPKQSTKIKWIEDPNQEGTNKIVSTDKLKQKIKEFRDALIGGIEAINYNQTPAAQLYDWIIRPFVNDGDISPEKIKTLVFLQDGFLRSVPMAALYDKQQEKYLVETYAIATTPSLRLTTPKQQRNKQKALILGLTEEAEIDGKKFSKLHSVDDEVKAIKDIFLNNHTDLIGDKFIPKNFEKALQKTTYPIVHIASHAQFGIIPEDTFIVTGKNQKLTISQLEQSLRNIRSQSDDVELLALTACETAVGDDRATLGLAGVALQVGVQSAIASLWSVQDASTSRLVKEFYTNYRQGEMSIAQALQKAQIKMIHAKKLPPSEDMSRLYDNPAHWAPMIVIGNWL